MTTAVDEIVIENVGPVEQLHIPLPEGGGVVVLTGDNGSGKSETLSCVRALCGSNDDKKALRPRDGEKTGLVEGCGVTIKVGRSNREAGELTVAALEDRLDIADLVDPGIADQNAADARRLKSLIRVSGVKADLSLFDSLLGDTFEIDSKVLKETDLINMAGGVKRALESKARDEEKASEAASLQATTSLKSVEGIDLTAEADEATLQADYRAAVKVQADLEQQAKASRAAQQANQTAREALERAKADYVGPSVESATETYDDALHAQAEAREKVAELTEQLRVARETLSMTESKVSKDLVILNAARQHVDTIKRWSEQIDQSVPPMPTDDAILEAEAALQTASKALQQGQVVRNALAKVKEADGWRAKQKAHSKQADHWRDNAKAVDDVLSEVVAGLGCPIKVGTDDKGLRLTIDHPRRGKTFFSELSAGEKYAVVIPIAIKAVGEGGMFVIPQEAWEGLQPRVRRQIRQLLKGSHVVAITAQSADGPLTAVEEAA